VAEQSKLWRALQERNTKVIPSGQEVGGITLAARYVDWRTNAYL